MTDVIDENVEDVNARRARWIMRTLTRKSIKYGGESYEKVMRVPFPGGLNDPRNVLLESLAAAVGDAHANSIVDAFDTYLATDPTERTPALRWSAPNPHAELDKTIQERDEAVARAERAEQALAKKTKKRAARPKSETPKPTTG